VWVTGGASIKNIKLLGLTPNHRPYLKTTIYIHFTIEILPSTNEILSLLHYRNFKIPKSKHLYNRENLVIDIHGAIKDSVKIQRLVSMLDPLAMTPTLSRRSML